jgi:hypothetical protein
MTNNTTADSNVTATNETGNMTTGDDSDTMLGGLIDVLIGSPVLIGLLLVVVGAGAVAYYKVPAFKMFVDVYASKLLSKHEAEILELIEKNLTPKMREKLSVEAEKHLKNEILVQVILSNFDHTEKKAQGTVKKLIRDLAKEA